VGVKHAFGRLQALLAKDIDRLKKPMLLFIEAHLFSPDKTGEQVSRERYYIEQL
jgi:hypothetical protein